MWCRGAISITYCVHRRHRERGEAEPSASADQGQDVVVRRERDQRRRDHACAEPCRERI
jgi:hypothetical protein